MTTLTKVFVVLLVVFSIAFTVMTISVVAQTADWRDTALKYEEHAKIADANLRNMIAASAAEMATASDEIRLHLNRIAEFETEAAEQEARISQAQAQLAKLETEKNAADAMNRGLLSQLQVAQQTGAEYHAQRDDLEKRNIELERRNIDLSDRVNELTTRTVVLMEEKRQLERQLNILKDENERLAMASGGQGGAVVLEEPAGVATAGIEAVTPVADSAILGHVTEVDKNLVTISVGAADGAKEGMAFVIHRDGTYIGDILLSLVDPNQSAGRIIRQTEPPQPGDAVTDARWLARGRP